MSTADLLPAPAAPLPRVLLLGWEYAPRLTGGLGTASVRLAHALAERVELSVIVPRLPEYEAEETAEPALSELAAAADGPDELRQFPESADWRAERPRRTAPRPSGGAVSGVFADGEGAPAASATPTPGIGWPVRLTALSQLTPDAVRAATVAPRPPGYEAFARQVHRVPLGVLPYAERAPEKSTASLINSGKNPAAVSAQPIATKNSHSQPSLIALDQEATWVTAEMGRLTQLQEEIKIAPCATDDEMAVVERMLDEAESLSADLDQRLNMLGQGVGLDLGTAATIQEEDETRVSDADPDALTEALAPFRGPAINPLTLPSSNTEVVQFARLAARVASGDDVDVIYAHDWPTFLAGVEIRLEKRVPLVLHVHSTSYDRHGPPVQGWVFELERAAFRAADRIVVVSNYGATVLREQYGIDPERVRVVHHGLSAGSLGPQWEARPVGETPTVLFVGRLTSQKNPLGFVEIARLVAAQVPGVQFKVAGDGPQRSAVQAAADAAGFAEEAFELLGFLDDEAVTAALTAAAVVCLPARSEPFGLAALEAAAAGVPLVLSSTTGAAEVLPGARTADFDDVPALAAHIVELLRDEPARRRAVRENAAAARRLTWERAAEEVLTVLVEARG